MALFVLLCLFPSYRHSAVRALIARVASIHTQSSSLELKTTSMLPSSKRRHCLLGSARPGNVARSGGMVSRKGNRAGGDVVSCTCGGSVKIRIYMEPHISPESGNNGNSGNGYFLYAAFALSLLP
jgi:hypothetical protein